MTAESAALSWLSDHAQPIAAMSDHIWDLAEPGLCEAKSAAALCTWLGANFFTIECGLAGLPTAFRATFGSGPPHIALMAEYDATPGERQRPSPNPDPDPLRHAGFTDLHNGIGVASAAAAIAISKADLPGTITLFGTPAEKLCIGKPFLARDGHFDKLDAVIAWHPRPYTTLEWDTGPGCYQAEIFDFRGKSTYGATPWTGISAVDAVTLMNTILQFIREHLPPNQKISINEMISRGGDHPTAIPNHAQVWYVHRAFTRAGIEIAHDALTRAADAAALALGAIYTRRIIAATRPWLPNHALANLCYAALTRAGPPTFPPDAHQFAATVAQTLNRDITPLFDETLTPPDAGITKDFAGGADDINEFCWHAPTARLYIAFGLAAAQQPNWARSAFTRTSAAHTTIQTAARAMTLSVIDILTNPNMLDPAKEEFHRRRKEAGNLQPLLSPDVKTPTDLDSLPPYAKEHKLRQAPLS